MRIRKSKKLVNVNFNLGDKVKFSAWEKHNKRMRRMISKNRIKTFTARERRFLSAYMLKYPFDEDLRKDMWMVASGAKTLMRDNPGYYYKLLNEVSAYPNP